MSKKYREESLSTPISRIEGTVRIRVGERKTLVTDKYPDGLEYIEGEDLDNEHKHVAYWMDGGLRGAFTLGKVAPGHLLRITHKGKEPFGTDGQTVNVYDIARLIEE